MALAGPRLDTPSAIGDEGRPRAASLTIASLVVVGLGLGMGFAIGRPRLLLTVGTIVGLAVGGVGLVGRSGFAKLFVGHALLTLFGSLLVLGVVAVPFLSPWGTAIAGLLVALTGIGLSWSDTGNAEGMERIVSGTALTYVATIVTIGVLVVGLIVVLIGFFLVQATTEGTAPGAASAWFAATVAYTAAGLRVLQWRLPTAELFPRDRRPQTARRVTLLGYGLVAVAILGGGAAAALTAATLGGVFDQLAAVSPAIATALDALGSARLLAVLAGVGTLALLLAAVVTVARASTRQIDTTTVRRSSAVAAGGFLGAVWIAFLLTSLVGNLFSVLSVIAVLFGPILVLAVAGLGLAGTYAGLVPDRAGGPALAALGLVFTAIGLGRAPAPLLFATVAGAVVVWDVSAFGLGVTAELGHIPKTRRLELFHGVLAVGVGLVAVAGLSAIDLVRTAAFGGLGGTTALFLAGVGVLLLLLPLRG